MFFELYNYILVSHSRDPHLISIVCIENHMQYPPKNSLFLSFIPNVYPIGIVYMVGFSILSCTGDKNGSIPLSQQNNGSSDNAALSISAEQAFRVPERPWDLAVHPNGDIYCTTQSGSKVYYWNPNTEVREETSVRFQDIQGLWITDEEDFYYTTTDYGVTGTLSVMVGHTKEVLYTQADDGTLFRWPMDLIPDPADGGWILADYNAGVLFVIEDNGFVHTQFAGSQKPQALTYLDPYLYIGGEDGVFRINWPDGTPEQIDDRAAYGLVTVEHDIWGGNADDGVFIVTGDSLGLNEAARVGPLLATNDGLYFGDHVGEGVWFVAW